MYNSWLYETEFQCLMSYSFLQIVFRKVELYIIASLVFTNEEGASIIFCYWKYSFYKIYQKYVPSTYLVQFLKDFILMPRTNKISHFVHGVPEKTICLQGINWWWARGKEWLWLTNSYLYYQVVVLCLFEKKIRLRSHKARTYIQLS